MKPAGMLLLALLVGSCQQVQHPASARNSASPGLALLAQDVEPRQPGRFAPRDTCKDLPGGAEFRLELAEALANEDTATLAALAAPDIVLSFGGDKGRAGFIRELREPTYLADLRKVIPLGCAAAESGMVMPWFFAQDLGEVDPYFAMVVLGSAVPLLARPQADATAVTRISWDVVTLVGSLEPEDAYQHVRHASGKTGYIATDLLRGTVDTRILAARVGGKWRITAIVAGD